MTATAGDRTSTDAWLASITVIGPNSIPTIPLEAEPPSVCAEIQKLTDAIKHYNDGSRVNYAPRPNGTTTFNSNAFTFTLLSDIGLAATFSQYIDSSPGWGYVVPGLK